MYFILFMDRYTFRFWMFNAFSLHLKQMHAYRWHPRSRQSSGLHSRADRLVSAVVGQRLFGEKGWWLFCSSWTLHRVEAVWARPAIQCDWTSLDICGLSKLGPKFTAQAPCPHGRVQSNSYWSFQLLWLSEVMLLSLKSFPSPLNSTFLRAVFGPPWKGWPN